MAGMHAKRVLGGHFSVLFRRACLIRRFRFLFFGFGFACFVVSRAVFESWQSEERLYAFYFWLGLFSSFHYNSLAFFLLFILFNNQGLGKCCKCFPSARPRSQQCRPSALSLLSSLPLLDSLLLLHLPPPRLLLLPLLPPPLLLSRMSSLLLFVMVCVCCCCYRSFHSFFSFVVSLGGF